MKNIPENCPSCNSQTQWTHLGPPQVGIAYGCTKCSWGGWTDGEDHNKTTEIILPLEEPKVNSTTVKMEMVVGNVAQNDDGSVKTNYFVKFSTGDGHSIIYPWEGLKETVKQWIEIEESHK